MPFSQRATLLGGVKTTQIKLFLMMRNCRRDQRASGVLLYIPRNVWTMCTQVAVFFFSLTGLRTYCLLCHYAAQHNENKNVLDLRVMGMGGEE